VSDEICDPTRPDADVRPLTGLLAVLGGAHAVAALAGVLPGGWGALPLLADAALAAVLLAGVAVALLAPRVTRSPVAVEAAAVLAICLAGLVSGLRAAAGGDPWAGADVALAVLAAVTLPTRGEFVAAAAGAQVAWLGVWIVGLSVGSVSVSAAAAVLLLTATLAVTVAAALLRTVQSRIREDLATAHRTANQQAVTDPLTGVTNRRGLELMALPMIEHARRQGEAVHCLFIDLDGFRSVNDAMGRGSGDEVLAAACEAVLASVRATDVVGRWAGDQFVVIGPGTGTSPLEMERRVRTQLTEAPPVPTDVWDARVSIGSATLVPWDEGNIDSLLRRAEEDMQLRRSLRRQSRARSSLVVDPSGELRRSDRRSNPPKTPPSPPSSPSVSGDL
jgi:diguanylate cyclase (GGDEF)-like protein